ncbi:MAG TPA: DUF5682 family protein, partial [Gemmataceae bacterium]|nr:DUF5682 family protein [Gemmataceae bacterium]
RFLRGLLRTTRSALWQVPDVLRSLHELLSEWEEEHFIRQLPNLRLAFADLTPRECDQVAREVAGQAGVATLKPVEATNFTSADMLQGAEVNRRVLEGLRRDGLEDLGS